MLSRLSPFSVPPSPVLSTPTPTLGDFHVQSQEGLASTGFPLWPPLVKSGCSSRSSESKAP